MAGLPNILGEILIWLAVIITIIPFAAAENPSEVGIGTETNFTETMPVSIAHANIIIV